ncbi:RNA-directed DNA polymerase, eukaryota [Tanacetum coccineum]
MLTFGGRGTSTHVLLSMRALYSSHIACFQLGSHRAWNGDLEIGEEVVTWKLYLGLGFTVPTLERVTIGCFKVGGGGGGVTGGIGVVCGDGVDSEVKAPVSRMIISVPEKDRWCGARGKFVRWKGIRVTKASERANVGVRGEDVHRSECITVKGDVTIERHQGDQDVDCKGKVISSRRMLEATTCKDLYIEPEIYKDELFNGGVDVYSFGIILYEMMEGVQPFYPKPPEEAVKLMCVDVQRPTFKTKSKYYPPDPKDLIEECWYPDLSIRPKFSEIIIRLDKIVGYSSKQGWFKDTFKLPWKPRDGVEMLQLLELEATLDGIYLPMAQDRWSWSIVGSGKFSVASEKKYIDDHLIGGHSSISRWVKAVPIKINIMAWKVRFDYLPTRLNLSKRGLDLQYILCPMCNKEVESTNHILFACSMVRELYRRVVSWKKTFVEVSHKNSANTAPGSYAFAVKKGPLNSIKENEMKPALVLDDSCYQDRDFSLSLLESKGAKENFLSHVGAGSWFSSLQQPSDSFHTDERIAWIDIEGVPIMAWKRVCIKTKMVENIFESFKIIVKGKVYWTRVKEVTGWNPDFMEEDDTQTESDNATIQSESDEERIPKLCLRMRKTPLMKRNLKIKSRLSTNRRSN